jgi:predicted HTH transcriptional regulator
MYKIQEALSVNTVHLSKLKKLVAQGEGQRLEFKRKLTHPEKVAREFVAFANADGGILLVGVEDDGGIHGVKHAEGDAHALKEALKLCRPGIPIKESYIPVSNSRAVIQYEIAASENKPHRIKEGELANTYVRFNDKCIKASKEVCEVLKRSRKKDGVKFTYGDHEKILMQYLDTHTTITLPECARLLKINKWKASRKLVLLTLADVLKITPTEKGDLYARNEKYR